MFNRGFFFSQIFNLVRGRGRARQVWSGFGSGRGRWGLRLGLGVIRDREIGQILRSDLGCHSTMELMGVLTGPARRAKLVQKLVPGQSEKVSMTKLFLN